MIEKTHGEEFSPWVFLLFGTPKGFCAPRSFRLFSEKEEADGIFFLLLQKENVCAPILFFLFLEKEKNRRAR